MYCKHVHYFCTTHDDKIKQFWFLNQARVAEGRVHLVSWNYFGSRVGMCVCVCVCVCVSAPEAINNQWHDMV